MTKLNLSPKQEGGENKYQQVQKDLEVLKRYIEDFFLFLPLAVCDLNPLGRIINVNKSFEKLTGFKKIDINGSFLKNIFFEKEKFENILKIIKKNGLLEDIELTLISKEKEQIPVNITIMARQDEQGSFIGSFLALFDITEIKELKERSEKKIKERTKELRESRIALLNILEDAEYARALAETERDKTLTIIENFPEGLLFFDQQGVLNSINPIALEFFDLKKKHLHLLIGKDLQTLKEISSFNLLVKILDEKIKIIYRRELKLKNNLILEVSSIPVLKEKEKIGTIISLRDITREKVVQQLKSEFVSITAHQLRTPLSAIKWTLKMLLDGDIGKITEEQKDLLSKTYQSNERMIKLINDLLNIARIEEGRFLYKLQKQDIIEIIEKINFLFGETIQKKKIKFNFEKPKEQIPELKIDSEKIELAIQNLIDNAVQYTSIGGQVEVIVKYLKDKKSILIQIKDTGIGIPKEQQKRVFSRFFRGENAIRKETKGTGLGLFIAKNIIESHGGKIWFESEQDKGTSFYFTLPINKQ